MARERDKLSKPACDKEGVGLHSDGGGLYLQVSKGGGRSWIFRYTFNKKRRDAGLGSYPAVGIAAARRLRDECETLVRSGQDPIVTRKKAETFTFKEMTGLAFEARKSSLKGDGAAGKWMSPMSVHVIPKLGNRDITTIDQNDIANLLRPIWRIKTSASEKALQRIGIVMKHAEAAGLDVDPRVVDKAKHLLGDQGHIVEHIPSMPWQDLPAFYASLGDAAGDAALKFLILTAARSAPVRLADSHQIHEGVWTIPAEFMKGRKTKAAAFRIPLCTEALNVIDGRNGLLFPGPKGKPISDMTMAAVLKRRGMDYRPHGFRATFKTWADDNDVDWVLSEVCLAHSVGSKASQSYARSDLLERRSGLMETWANHIIGGQSKIVHLAS